jgi:hypothetical protein
MAETMQYGKYAKRSRKSIPSKLHRRVVELQEAEEKCLLARRKLADGQSLLQAIINSIHVNMAVIDVVGKIILVNRAGESFARDNGDASFRGTGIGANYFESLAHSPEDETKGIRAVIAHYDITDLKRTKNERETSKEALRVKNVQLEQQKQNLIRSN